MKSENEVRRGDDGRLYLWEITTSDVPGEGGARRVSVLDLVLITEHELALRQQLAALEAEIRTGREKLAVALDLKRQVEEVPPLPG